MYSLKFRIKVFFMEHYRKLNVFGGEFRKHIYRDIGYYYQSLSPDDRKKIEQNIMMLRIHSVWYSKGYVWIKCERPGILIGKKGENINNLSKFISSNWPFYLPFKGIKLKEEKELSHLYNYQYSYSDWDG